MDYENDLALKTLYPSPPGPFASLGMAHLFLEVSFCSFFGRSVVSHSLQPVLSLVIDHKLSCNG